MTDGLYSPADLELFFEGKSFDAVFQMLRRIWNPDGKSIREYYREGEIETNKLEETLLELYPDLYGELIKACKKEKVAYCLVFMDSLSIREAMRLKADLQEQYEIGVGYSFSALPSDTDPYKHRIFGRINIAQWESPDFKFIHDLSSMSVLPESDTLTIWTQLPDDKLHHTRSGHAEPWAIEDVYADTRRLLAEILQTCRHDEVVVTSDHGYVDLTASCTFPIGEKWKKMLSNQFKERWRKKENNWELEQLYEQKIIRYVEEYYVINGRYTHITGRGKVNTRKHGGLSMMECMTPVLNIRRK
jgi:hypothetical protein